MAGPFIDIPQQMPVDGFQMLGVETTFGVLSVLDFIDPGNAKFRFQTFRLVVSLRPKLVLDGIGASVVGHAL